MKSKRREFLKLTGAASLGLAGNMFKGFAANSVPQPNLMDTASDIPGDTDLSIIGLYGPWAASLTENKLPSLSFRRKEFKDVNTWRSKAKRRVIERLGVPDIGGLPKVTVKKKYEYDGLQIEELSWQLPYGRPTEAIVLKPLNAKGKLPGILAFHDHAGNKYYGTKKITRTSDQEHPLMAPHLKRYYDGGVWANEMAKRGYVVLISDAFAFGSRRVMLQDVPARQRKGLTDPNPEDANSIVAYNEWAEEHEAILAKSLFSAGTTWPGVFFAEDQKALDILCAREDVDASRVGCGGLSGGGLRTDYLAALDPRIKCSVTVGFMTTWKDFLLNKAFTHTWMTYVPLLPNELDFPEILALRAPQPTLVLNDEEDNLFTLDEMKKADNILKEIFTKANAGDRYQCTFHPGLHKFDKKMQQEAFDWFDKWLKG